MPRNLPVCNRGFGLVGTGPLAKGLWFGQD